MKLTHILRAVYCEPWLIRPEMHKQICEIVTAHVNGSAHAEKGIADMFEGQEQEVVQFIEDMAVIDINGVIGRKVSDIEKSSGVTDVNDIADALQMAVEDPTVNGIILRIDSPGGTVAGVPELAMLVRDSLEEKPVVTLVDGMAASAAYWIGSQAHAIMGGMSSVVGSVGVYMPFLDQSRQFEMAGLKMDVIKAGKFKGLGIQGTSLTEDQRDLLQREVNAIHEMFKGAVRIGRGGMDEEYMQGQDFMGEEALAIGMIDQIGNLSDAIELARKYKEMVK